MEIKVKAIDNQIYISEIFGGQNTEALLLKNLSQKTKFHLKKLGNTLVETQKDLAAQAKELVDQYITEDVQVKDKEGVLVFNEDGSPKMDKVVPEDKKEEWEKKITELNNMIVPIQCFSYVEDDFVDVETKKVVSSKTYYNLLDLILYSEETV
jgi:hypothetical protein